MSTHLTDAHERARITGDLDALLFVEAGAGTGKTRELVERLLALVKAGVSVRSIAAITFTEAAAAELRDRVRIELERMHDSGDPGAVQLANAALDQLDGAALETLHSFAGRLLGLFPIEAGLPPRFRVLDQVAYAVVADQEWERALAEILDDADLERPLTYALALNVRTSSRRYRGSTLRGLFEEFGQNWDRLAREPFDVDSFEEPSVDGLVAALDKAIIRRSECRVESDNLVGYLDDLADYRRRLAHATSPVQRARVLSLSVRGLSNRTMGRRENWPDAQSVRDAISDALEIRSAMLADLGAMVLPPLLEAVRKAALDFADRRRSEGTVAFHDLLVLARNLLQDHPEAREHLHHRYQRILVDEFQDTDPLQATIADLIARCPDGTLEPGRVFFVGDAKQSIYRFRRADIALFRESRERFGCEPAVLGSNFRSTEAVLAWCNDIFGQLLHEEDGQARYQPLTAARADPSRGTVHLLGGPVGKLRTAEAREVEAAGVARALRFIHAGRWPVYDRAIEGWRPARFDDVAVLIRNRMILPALQVAFEDIDIPYRVESRSLVYEMQETRDLASILAAIDDPTDEVAVVAALRSPGFGCGDDDLLRHRQTRGRWEYMASTPAPAAPSRVEAGLAFLREMHERRFTLPLGDLVETVIRERYLREVAWAYRRPREHWQRYRFLLEQVRLLEAEHEANLHSLVLWLRRQADQRALVNESVVPEEDDDAVRVMTVHAAKGLEFPIVIMAGFGTQTQQEPRIVWGDDGEHPEVKLGNAATRGFDESKVREQELEVHERNRLLYVASTRARDHLVVSVFHSEARRSAGDSDAEKLLELSEGAPHLWQWLEPPAVQTAMTPAAEEPAVPPLPGPDTWAEARLNLLQRQHVRSSVTATELGRLGEQSPEADDRADAVFRRGRGGTAVGRAVHAVLQSVDLATGDTLGRLAAAEAAAEAVPARAAEVARLARAALASGPVVDAVASGRYWREVFVSGLAGDILVEGFIDLLYEDPRGLVVVDYKTDSVESDADIDAALAEYRLQGAAYALVLQRNLGRPVAACRFLFLRPSGTRTVEVADLQTAVEDAESAVRSLSI